MDAEDVAMGIEEEYGLSGDAGSGNSIHPEVISTLAHLLADEYPNSFDNAIGGRLYLDGVSDSLTAYQHFEGCTPECAGEDAPFELSLRTRALDSLVLDLFHRVVGRELGHALLPAARYHLLKDSTDWRENYYGRQMNFRITTDIKPAELIRNLAPYLCTKIIWAGQGGVKPARDWLTIRFVLSPRALGIRSLCGNDTTRHRALICTSRFGARQSHDMSGWNRLQIPSDPLVLDFATYVDAGITSLILRLISKKKFLTDFPYLPNSHTAAAQAIQDMHAISCDPALQARIHLGGESFSALDLQKKYLELLRDHEDILGLTDRDRDVLGKFGDILSDLEKNPLLLADRCEAWFLYKVCLAKLEKENTTWGKCGQVEVSYRDRTVKLPYYLLALARQMAALDEWGILPHAIRTERVTSLHTFDAVLDARQSPPVNSRAWWRKKVFERARELRIPAEAGQGNSSKDSWSAIRFPVPVSILQHPENIVENPDPTGRLNEEKLREAEEIFDKILRASSRIISI